jgi:putative ABC transport system permease protein
MAVETLWSNKLHTGLTMLGVIIGISSVIAITSVGQGVQKGVEQQIQALGTDVLQILAGAARSGNVRQGVGSSSTLTWEDAKAIATQAPSVQLVSAYLQRNAQVVYAGQNTSTTIYGSDLNYPEVRNTHPQQGRYFTQQELNTTAQVAILGPTVQRTLFAQGSNVIGERIRIQGEAYEVIGVMEPKGSQGPMEMTKFLFL